MMSEQGMKPIWYFVGLILMVIGGIVFCSGIFQFFHPPVVKTTLAEIHANIWWGALMTVFGTGMYFTAKKKSK
jgi:multisubunit Na+/H+ antiporter MnhG subunit